MDKKEDFGCLIDSIKTACISIERNFIGIGKTLNLLYEKKLYKAKYIDFNAFVDNEFSFNHSQARKFMRVAKEFPSLDNSNPRFGLGISRLYELTFVPKEEREEILEEIDKDNPPPLKEIRDKVKRFKSQPVNIERPQDDEITRLRRQGIVLLEQVEDFKKTHDILKDRLKEWYDNTTQFQHLDGLRDQIVKLFQSI